jgi:hypothetical protein
MIALANPQGASRLITMQPAHRMAELQKTISASRLGLWLCRLKFYFRYILQFQKPPTPNMHAGSAVHAVLQHWNLSRWRRESFTTERFKVVFRSPWTTLQLFAALPGYYRWQESGLELHHLVKTKAPRLIISSTPPTTEQQQTRLFRQIESYQQGLARRDFVPSSGFHCASCEFITAEPGAERRAMDNSCNNRLTVRGSKEQVQRTGQQPFRRAGSSLCRFCAKAMKKPTATNPIAATKAFFIHHGS